MRTRMATFGCFVTAVTGCAKLAGIEETSLAPHDDAAIDTPNTADVLPDACGPACQTFASCKELQQQFPGAPSGIYKLLSGAGMFSAYCDQAGDGGGWTLALKVDGAAATFQYDQAIWTNTTLLAGSTPGFDHTESKLETFNSMAFTQLRIGLEFPIGSGTVRYAVLAVPGTSLNALFAGAQVQTSLGRASWEALMGTGSLQANCNLEGVNVGNTYQRARIGILGNQEADCASPDSRIGIGGADMAQCAFTASESAGNTACNTTDNGDGVHAAFAYVFVR